MMRKFIYLIIKNSLIIHNGNCAEWSAIWSESKRVITKSHDREAGERFVITSLIQTKIARHDVQFPLYYIHFEIYKQQR